MNLFVIMMLLNMALVWLMMYFSICLMIIISICFMIIVSREYFEITFISRKKGLCWPSVWDYLHFDIRSAQSAERFFMIPVSKWYMTFISKWAMRSYFRFEMLYDCHFEMRGAKFSSTELFSSGEPQIFYWRKCIYYYYFRTQLFTQGLVPILAFK